MPRVSFWTRVVYLIERTILGQSMAFSGVTLAPSIKIVIPITWARATIR